MIYFLNKETDPHYNLALEEVLVKSDITEDIFLLWQNYNSIIVGRNQNPLAEINLKQAALDDVQIVRRLTGGGTVFHDEGNLNFTFIMTNGKTGGYAAILEPIITVLRSLGLNAQFVGKNDIEIDGKKISGNAQYIYKNHLLHHGTILFDVDLNKMPRYLKVDSTKITSKGIKSIPARMVNIKSLLSQSLTIQQFQEFILQQLVKNQVEIRPLPIEIDLAARELAVSKYRQWDWNFGSSPEFSYSNKLRFEGKGSIEVQLNVERGMISAIKFYGDFLGSAGTETLEAALVNCKYQSEAVRAVIAGCDYRAIFGKNFTIEDIISVMIPTK